jgi:hypothetical protein
MASESRPILDASERSSMIRFASMKRAVVPFWMAR